MASPGHTTCRPRSCWPLARWRSLTRIRGVWTSDSPARRCSPSRLPGAGGRLGSRRRDHRRVARRGGTRRADRRGGGMGRSGRRRAVLARADGSPVPSRRGHRGPRSAVDRVHRRSLCRRRDGDQQRPLPAPLGGDLGSVGARIDVDRRVRGPGVLHHLRRDRAGPVGAGWCRAATPPPARDCATAPKRSGGSTTRSRVG